MSNALREAGAYQSLQMILQDAFGVVIGEGRNNLMLAKLKPVMADFSLNNLDDLVDALQKKNADGIRNSVLQAITAREDAWFEPKELFGLLDNYLLAEMLDSDRRNYKIWVIGCGAGQLPYSLAMSIDQARKKIKSATEVAIEATDVPASVVVEAARGVYQQSSLVGIADTVRNKFMDQKSGLWHVNDDIKSMITFSTCNLLEDIKDRGHYNLIICLDVLVYFSVPIKTRLLDSFARLLSPAGMLVAGLNEPVLPFNTNFEMVRHDAGIFYRQKS